MDFRALPLAKPNGLRLRLLRVVNQFLLVALAASGEVLVLELKSWLDPQGVWPMRLFAELALQPRAYLPVFGFALENLVERQPLDGLMSSLLKRGLPPPKPCLADGYPGSRHGTVDRLVQYRVIPLTALNH